MSRFLTLLVTVFLFTSCGPKNPHEVSLSTQSSTDEAARPAEAIYKAGNLKTSLRNLSAFKVLSDFNSAEPLNERGMPWTVEPEDPQIVNLEFSRDDAVSPTHGYSLKAVFQLPAGEKAVLSNPFGTLDVSAAENFGLKCRLEPATDGPFPGRVRLTLEDHLGESVIADITRFCPTRDMKWGTVIFPKDKLSRLDLNQLSKMEIKILAGNQETKGALFIDEISFMGPGDVEYESHRDNIPELPKDEADPAVLEKLSNETDDRAFLMQVARDTWKYFLNSRDKKTHLIVDHLRSGDGPLIADYTSTTNIAMDFMATVAAYDLGFVSRPRAVERIRQTLATMKKMKRWRGFFYNFYHTRSLEVTRPFVSSVDSGWFAISLVIVRQAFREELWKDATKLLDDFNFDLFLDPENQQLSLGYDEEKQELLGYHYGMLASEARATSFYAIGKGDIMRDHWWFIYRTPPEAWDWQRQKPQGHFKTVDGVDYFQGYYAYRGKKFIPSWGGSLFEYLMPTLVMKEKELAPKGLGKNDRVAVELQMEYAYQEMGYPVWGISPAAVSSGKGWRYMEMGIKEMSVKGYPDLKVITPHVSFLALDPYPEAAIDNIRRLFLMGMYGDYGFYDTLNLRSSMPNTQYLALDQGMTLVALCNYLHDGSIKERFHQDPVGKNAQDLLSKESFFNT